jgi:hypothetical protein
MNLPKVGAGMKGRTGNPRSYPNIDKSATRKGQYRGYAGLVNYTITGQSGDWRARLEDRYINSLWDKERLAPMSFQASDFADLSARLARIEAACATRPEGSSFHPNYRTSNPAASRIPAGFVLLGGGEGKYPYTLIYTKPLGHKGANYYPFVLLGDDGRGLVSSWDEGDFRSLKSQGYSASGHKVSLSQLPAAVRSAVAHYIEELPLRAAGRTGNPPASPFVLLDAGPRENDRYTLICTTPQGSGSRSYYNYLGFGTGVSGHGEFTASDFRAFKAEGYRSLGKRIKIESLPASFHRLAERFMAECG